MKTIQNYINHIVFVIDRSGSMRRLVSDVITVFDSQIEYLARRSKELDQETREISNTRNGSPLNLTDRSMADIAIINEKYSS